MTILLEFVIKFLWYNQKRQRYDYKNVRGIIALTNVYVRVGVRLICRPSLVELARVGTDVGVWVAVQLPGDWDNFRLLSAAFIDNT